MRKFFPIFFISFFICCAANAQMHLKLDNQISSDNLNYKQSEVASGLKLNFNSELLAPPNERLNRIKMMLILNFVYALTFGDFGKNYSGAIGAQFTYGYLLAQQFLLIGSIGYLKWILKEDLPSGVENTFSSIPIMVGLRYFLLTNLAVLLPYLTVQVGLHLLKQTFKYNLGNFNFEDSNSETKFGFNIGAGTLYAIAAAFFIDFSIRYMFISGDPNSISNLGFFLGGSYAIQ
ncbi:MAG: outer membrane beta-barrel protein [Ignavibacteriaceae bacterium]